MTELTINSNLLAGKRPAAQRRRRRSGWSGQGRTTFQQVVGLISRLQRRSANEMVGPGVPCTQARLCPACRRFSYKSFPLFCEQIMQKPGAARPDCIGTHVLLNTHAYIYDVQLLAIWRILLLAVVSLLSLALRVGLMRRLPTSSCPFLFPKTPLTLFYIICHARVIFYVQWPDHF